MPLNQRATQTITQPEVLDETLFAFITGGSAASLPPPPPLASPSDSDKLIPFPDKD